MTRDLRTLIYLLNLELREECSRTLGPGMQSGSSSRSGRNRACSIQFKRTQPGSSSSSGHNRGAAVEADAIGRRAAAEAGAIGEQQLDARRRQTGSASMQQWKRMPQSGPGAAAEADASGEASSS